MCDIGARPPSHAIYERIVYFKCTMRVVGLSAHVIIHFYRKLIDIKVNQIKCIKVMFKGS